LRYAQAEDRVARGTNKTLLHQESRVDALILLNDAAPASE
jgi:hypothetical protein